MATKRKTWRDWLPPDAPEPRVETLLTRDQLLARVSRLRPAIAETTLRSWERAGVLPHPIRRWHEGAVRAVYPPWYLDLVRQIRRLQRDGYPLAAIAAELEAYVQETHGRAPIGQWRREQIVLGPALVGELQRLAVEHERITGAAATAVEVWVITGRGRTCYPLPLGATESDDTPDTLSSPPTESD